MRADLAKRVLHMLTRHGFVNFGFFRRLVARRTRKPQFAQCCLGFLSIADPCCFCWYQPDIAKLQRQRRILVLGGGMAGLAAARHLDYLGFQAIVVEPRVRERCRLTDPGPSPHDLQAVGGLSAIRQQSIAVCLFPCWRLQPRAYGGTQPRMLCYNPLLMCDGNQHARIASVAVCTHTAETNSWQTLAQWW